MHMHIIESTSIKGIRLIAGTFATMFRHIHFKDFFNTDKFLQMRECPIVWGHYNLFPRNIFAHAANQEIIPLLIFALMIGFTFVKLRDRIPSLSTFKDGIDALNTLLFGIVRSIIKLTPYAVLSLIAYATSRHSANIDL